MISAQIEIQLIAVVVAVACALPGVFLVLRRMAMMSDAISHSILLGIVLAFFVTKDLASPFLIIAAAATGVFTIVLVELLNRTRLVQKDAAIGLVFPLLFSIGVILIAQNAGNVHLDTDAVLLGELAFAPFHRLELFGIDFGPISLSVMGGILLINLIFILLFLKELKLVTFDAGLATALGFSPAILHYSLMSLVSVTAVGAFDAVGSILVVALMIGPPVTAYLLTDRLGVMLGLSAIIGAVSAVSGYWLAHWIDGSIAGSMASMVGVYFFVGYLFAPERGLIAIAHRRKRQKTEFALKMLLVHLLNHEDEAEGEQECNVNHLPDHLNWDKQLISRIIQTAKRKEYLTQEKDLLHLTVSGKELAEISIVG